MRFGLVAAFGTDIDPQSGYFRDLIAFLALHEVNRFFADDPYELGFVADDSHALTDELLRVPTADPAKVQEPFLIDVGDDKTYFVDVPR